MYVCLCNGFTDRQVQNVAPMARSSAARVFRALGARPQCGKCVPMVKEIVRHGSEASINKTLAEAHASD
ncbi:MAG: (2Fe-2S)-binding protein [Acetobacteraceae bacterium]|nr:(2Fe-2S)-binding protein [Acetobacteraceae bacterium]